MPAFYSVIQYVPDTVADERINVGVLVFSEGRVRSRFLQNWDRVRRFAQKDIDYVRDFADWVSNAAVQPAGSSVTMPLPGFSASMRPDQQTIRQIATEWSNGIQITTPQPSLEDPDRLLLKMAEIHLREPEVRTRVFRDRQMVARDTVTTVRRAFSKRLGPTRAGDVVHADYPIGGRVVPNIRVDMAITNGRIYLASQALSFETHDVSELDRQMRDAVYTLRDVSDLSKQIRIDLVALPPKPNQQNYRRAEERWRDLRLMCNQIGAGLVVGEDVLRWASEIADAVGSEIETHAPRITRS